MYGNLHGYKETVSNGNNFTLILHYQKLLCNFTWLPEYTQAACTVTVLQKELF